MNSQHVSQQLLEEARLILTKDVVSALEAGNYSLVVRRSQEVVELTIKAFIKAAGYDFPKVHDPAPLLDEICDAKGIDLDSETLKEIRRISATLAEERAPAFYAERSYTLEDAQEATQSAALVFKGLSPLLG